MMIRLDALIIYYHRDKRSKGETIEIDKQKMQLKYRKTFDSQTKGQPDKI